MSSESESNVSRGEGSDLESNSSDDFDMPKWKPRKKDDNNKPSSSSVRNPKKARLEQSTEVSKVWKKPDLSKPLLGTLALLNLPNEAGSTRQIQGFIKEEFPHFSSRTKGFWKNVTAEMRRTVGLVQTTEKDGHSKIYRINQTKFGPLKDKLEKKLTKNVDPFKETMSSPANLDLWLKRLADYVCIEDEETSEKPKLSVLQLILDLFGGNYGVELTVNQIVQQISDQYPFYKQKDEQLNVKRYVRTQLQLSGVFRACNVEGQERTWKLDENNTGLALPSRISSVPPSIKTLIENGDNLFLLGNPTGKVANFYFHGDDPGQLRNYKSRENVCVTTEGPPGRYKCHISWMTCVDSSTCPFGVNCFNFIFGNSDQDYVSVTQRKISMLVTKEFEIQKKLLPDISIPHRPIDGDQSDDDETEYLGFDNDEGEDSDSSDDEGERFEKMSDDGQLEDDDKNNEPPRISCKGPLDFMLQYPGHEFKKENCLALFTTNNRKLKRTIKNFLRGAFKDISKSKGMYPQMSPEAYTIFDNLKTALPFRKKYLIRAQKEGRLSELPTPESSTKSFNILMTREEYDMLGREGQVITKGPKGEQITITIK